MQADPIRGLARAQDLILRNRVGNSPRSGWQRKAWGVSPRNRELNSAEPAKRATACSLNCTLYHLFTHGQPSHSRPLRGLAIYLTSFLGLKPQALCFRLLRRPQGSLFALRAQCGRDVRAPSRSWATFMTAFSWAIKTVRLIEARFN